MERKTVDLRPECVPLVFGVVFNGKLFIPPNQPTDRYVAPDMADDAQVIFSRPIPAGLCLGDWSQVEEKAEP